MVKKEYNLKSVDNIMSVAAFFYIKHRRPVDHGSVSDFYNT